MIPGSPAAPGANAKTFVKIMYAAATPEPIIAPKNG